MKQHSKLSEKVLFRADLPGESLPNQPLIELIGDRRVLIENHLGVICYGNCDIKVSVRYGTICIQGSGLQLVNMTHQQLIVTGQIDSVSIKRGNK